MINRKIVIFFTLLCIVLMPGCSTLSAQMEAYRNSYHGLKVNVYKMGSGSYGVMGISSLKMDGYETMQVISNIGYSVYNPTPKPFHPAWFTCSAIITFDFPHTIEVTWFIYEEQQLYHTTVTMSSYKEIQKTMGNVATSTIGLGIILDMPPQIKCFIFDSTPYANYIPQTYHLGGTGMGTPLPGSQEKFAYLTRHYCEKGLLSDRVCAPYRESSSTVSTPEATRRPAPQKPVLPLPVDAGSKPIMTDIVYPANTPR